MGKIERYKPAVMNSLLILTAGLVWICVGIMLLVFAFVWLSTISSSQVYIFSGAGGLLALIFHHFGFLKIVDTNMKRILQTNDKKCLFSFIPWKSYLIIVVMIALGAMLRHSAIPRQYLAILYVGIGLALLLSSVRYMRAFFREIKQ